MKKIYAPFIALMLLWTTGCSVLISTPPIARIQIHGSNNQLSEYIVVLDETPSESSLDIPISDSYVINLDFQWLFGAEENYSDTVNENISTPDLNVSPWMMCTYRF